MIRLHHVSAGYGGADKLHDLSFAIPDHGFVALIGPNGCGKSTLLRVLAGLLPHRGEMDYHGVPFSSMPRNLRARRISFLPQTRNIPDIPARTLIEYGRYPHLGFSKRLSPGDDAAVERAIALSGVSFLLDRPVSSLSGGERQRVYLAMLLAQDCETLLLDEPTTFLDIHAQLEVLEAIRAMRTGGKTIVAALHDIPQAFSYAQTVCILRDGRLQYAGCPQDPAAARAVEEVFGVGIRRCGFEGGALMEYMLTQGK